MNLTMRFSVSALVLGLAASVSAEQTINRRPDSAWNYIVKGSDVQKQHSKANGFAESSSQEAHPSYLTNYNMRAKVVDPASLGVDTVKQYSGYLDDTQGGKHLFFCKFWIFHI